MEKNYHIIFLLLGSLEGLSCLRILSFDVPRLVLSGENQSAVLQCSYDLEGQTLYSIRWYRDEYEFYRYTPKYFPMKMVFGLPRVDVSRSDNQRVTIVNLTIQLSGLYSCEVSTDAPYFHIITRSSQLTVADVLLHKPLLSVSRLMYARNDVLQANCSTAEAYPAPNITWIVNGNKVEEQENKPITSLNIEKSAVLSRLEIIIREKDSDDPHRINYDSIPSDQFSKDSHENNKNKLRYAIEPAANGQLSISCVATIFDSYTKKSETINIKEENPDSFSVAHF